jgi:hypothetical protein
MITVRRACLAVIVMLACLPCTHAVSAQTLSSVEKLVIVDANGKIVGPVAWAFSYGSPSQQYLVYEAVLQLNGQIFRVATYGGHSPLRPEVMVGNEGVYLVFESTDCSGTPYMAGDTNAGAGNIGDNIRRAVLGPPGLTAYLPNVSATPKQIVPLSYGSVTWVNPANEVGECMTGNPVPNEQKPFVVPALSLVDLAAVFTYPFNVVAAPSSCCGDCNGDGQVTIDELLTSVNHALNGCSAGTGAPW